jgi:hypothetical protein
MHRTRKTRCESIDRAFCFPRIRIASRHRLDERSRLSRCGMRRGVGASGILAMPDEVTMPRRSIFATRIQTAGSFWTPFAACQDERGFLSVSAEEPDQTAPIDLLPLRFYKARAIAGEKTPPSWQNMSGQKPAADADPTAAPARWMTKRSAARQGGSHNLFAPLSDKGLRMKGQRERAWKARYPVVSDLAGSRSSRFLETAGHPCDREVSWMTGGHYKSPYQQGAEASITARWKSPPAAITALRQP